MNPKDIYFKTYGKNHGYTLILLHGYLESSDVWEEFAKLFEDEYFVVCIDLPGHGKSASAEENRGMEQMAKAVIAVCDELSIPSFHLVGHSMGGYVAMELLHKYPERLNSVVLFHSHCHADSEEKKKNREREIELVRNGKKELIINTSIPKLFGDENLEVFSDAIENSLRIAHQTTDPGIVAALQAMKSRPDHSSTLAQTSLPVLLVGGAKDNLIPFKMMEQMKTLSPTLRLVCLEKSGHMGFIEEKDKAAEELKVFFDSSFECL